MKSLIHLPLDCLYTVILYLHKYKYVKKVSLVNKELHKSIMTKEAWIWKYIENCLTLRDKHFTNFEKDATRIIIDNNFNMVFRQHQLVYKYMTLHLNKINRMYIHNIQYYIDIPLSVRHLSFYNEEFSMYTYPYISYLCNLEILKIKADNINIENWSILKVFPKLKVFNVKYSKSYYITDTETVPSYIKYVKFN